MAATRHSKGHQRVEELLHETSSFRVVNELPLSEVADTTTRGWFDIALPDLKIIIEIDGAHHRKITTYGGEPEAAELRFEAQKNNDRRKDRLATDAGWLVVRFTDTEARDLDSTELWNRIREAGISRTLEILDSNPSALQKSILEKPQVKPAVKNLLQKQRDWRKQQYQKLKEWKKSHESNTSN